MAMIKWLDYAPVNNYGEPTVHVLGKDTMEKLASGSAFAEEALEFAKTLRPSKDKVYVLINAMGATDFYSSNRNGDAFYEDALKKYHKTFVSHAHPYMHHKNKDPEKAYGKVIFSAYNDKMKRVEIIVEYDTTKLDKKFVDKIDANELVNVSMGCRVPEDYCSICGNAAKTQRDYCKHLKDSPGLNKLMPDGRKAFAINKDPQFFDISIVTIPADPTARILAKLASTETVVSSLERAIEEFGDETVFALTSGNLEKTASGTVKTVQLGEESGDRAPELRVEVKASPGAPVEVSAEDNSIVDAVGDILKMFMSHMGPFMPDPLLDSIGATSESPIGILKSFIKNNVFLHPREAQRMMLSSVGETDLADFLDSKRLLLADDPAIGLHALDSCTSSDGQSLFDLLPKSFLSTRSLSPSNIKRITVRIIANPEVVDSTSALDKTAAIGVDKVQFSDDFNLLLGRKAIKNIVGEYLMSGATDGRSQAENRLLAQELLRAEMTDNAIDVLKPGILDRLKNAFAIGSLITALNSITGNAVTNELSTPLAALSLLTAPTLYDAIVNGGEKLNAPVQEMQFMNPNSREMVEATLLDALQNLPRGVKTASFGPLSNIGPITKGSKAYVIPKLLFSAPVAYGLAHVVSNEAKREAAEEAMMTGQYKPTYLSKPSITFPAAMAVLMKYAGARETAKAYIKTASASNMLSDDVYNRLEKILMGTNSFNK